MKYLSENKEPKSVSLRPSIAEKAMLAAIRKDMSFAAWVEKAIRVYLLIESDTPEYWEQALSDGENDQIRK
mgnify:FL=1